MSIDNPALVVLGLAGILAAAIALAVTWDRRRWVVRSLLATLSVLLVAATAGLQLNAMTEAYPSWSALLGRAPQQAEPVAPLKSPRPAGDPVVGPAQPPDPAHPGHGRFLTVTVAGKASGLNLRAYVYLPAGYDASPRTRFPVMQAAHGFPGTAATWLRRLNVQHYLDTEIAAGRMAPTVVVFPMQTPRALLDTECTDMVRGPRAETFLTTDVPAFMRAHFRVRTDRRGWGLIGYSAGGYCAINLLLRHPDRYAAAASLSGYDNPGIKVGDGSENTYNNASWRLQHLPQPWVSLFLAWADDDRYTKKDGLRMAALAHAPMQVTTAVLAHGGHSDAAWEQMEAPAFDWLSAHLGRPY